MSATRLSSLRRPRYSVLALLAALAVGAGCAGRQKGPDVASLPLDAPPPPPAPRALQFPGASERTLPNGLSVVVLPLPGSATVSVRLGLAGGGAAAERTGIAELTVEAMKLGVPGVDAAAFAERVESLGSSLSFDCESDFCTGQAESLSRNLEPTLALFADAVIRPTFPADEVRRLEGEWLAYLAYLESQPAHVGAVLVHRLLYGDHPYGRYSPTAADIRAITRDDVVDFHRRNVTPRGAILVAAGDVDPDVFLELAAKAFAAWDAPLSEAAPLATPAPVERGPVGSTSVVHLVDRPGAVQATVLVSHRALPRASADYLAARVADEVLGGGAARRLFLDLRERRGLTYGAGSSIDARRVGGHAVASADVRNEKVGEALRALLDQLAQLRTEPVPEPELRDATRYLAGALALRLDNPGTVAGLVLRQRLFDLPQDEWSSWPRRVQAIQPAAVLEAAKSLWSEDGVLIVVVGDADALTPQLEPLGEIVRYDPTAQPLAGP